MDDKVKSEDFEAFKSLISRSGQGGWVSDHNILSLHPYNKDTGLPTLPEGYFWRVFKQYGMPYVGLFYRAETVTYKGSLRSLFTGEPVKKTGVVERRLTSHYIGSTAEHPKTAIRAGTLTILRHLENRLMKVYAPTNFSDYYGAYPPKSL